VNCYSTLLNEISLKFNGICNTQGASGPFVHAETCHHHITCFCTQHVLTPCFDRAGIPYHSSCPMQCQHVSTHAQPTAKHLNYHVHIQKMSLKRCQFSYQSRSNVTDSRYSWPTMPSEGLSSFLFYYSLTSLTPKKT
jgi:hypothetical protein